MAVPAGLGARGRALWKSFGHERGTSLGELALEACRLVDRLDAIDVTMRGADVVDMMGANLLQEARQQQLALKQVLVILRSESDAPSVEGSPLDDLAKRRAARGANTAN